MKLQEVLYNQDNVSGLRKSFRNRVITMYTPQRMRIPKDKSHERLLPMGRKIPMISTEPARICTTEITIFSASFLPSQRRISAVLEVCAVSP